MASDSPVDIVEALQRSLRWLRGAGWKGFDCSPETLSRIEGWSRPPAVSVETVPEMRPPAPVQAPAPSAIVPPETLARIHQDLGDCQRCKLWRQRRHIVFGKGDPRARLVFVGEGPGFDEDRQGEPFVGVAGQLLTKIIQAMGLSREQVYICNIIKCHPPANRTPEADEIVACLPFLKRQLAAVSPECICALGAVAARALLETDLPISRLRGRFHSYQGIAVMPTFHPAYLLRNPEQKRAVWEDVQQVMARLGLP
jgi:uracil-DNA glycosylase